jgi:hypothetical protein
VASTSFAEIAMCLILGMAFSDCREVGSSIQPAVPRVKL